MTWEQQQNLQFNNTVSRSCPTTLLTLTPVHSVPVNISGSRLDNSNISGTNSASASASISTSTSTHTHYNRTLSSPSLKSIFISKKLSSYSRSLKKSLPSFHSNANSTPNSCTISISSFQSDDLLADQLSLNSSYSSTSTSHSSLNNIHNNHTDDNSMLSFSKLSCISMAQECLFDNHPLAAIEEFNYRDENGDDCADRNGIETQDSKNNIKNHNHKSLLTSKVSTSSSANSSSFFSKAKKFLSFNEKLHPQYPYQTNNTQKHNTPNNHKSIILNDAVPLETYRTTYMPITESDKSPSDSINLLKSREPRINSNFLRFYAIDYSNKLSNNLHINESEIDIYQQEFLHSGIDSIDDFVNNFLSMNYSNSNINAYSLNQFKIDLKLALLSRQKLWSNVILPPRCDILNKSNKKNYILQLRNCEASNNNNNNNNNNSNSNNNGFLVRNYGKFIPWLNLDDCNTLTKKSLLPYGTLSNNIQYTVKGWENERWSELKF